MGPHTHFIKSQSLVSSVSHGYMGKKSVYSASEYVPGSPEYRETKMTKMPIAPESREEEVCSQMNE